MKLTELNLKPIPKFEKAGLIPYIIEDGEVKMLFMKSSDSQYGGSDPMIAKGHVDEGETTEEAAVREAQEELGLKRSNMQGSPWRAWKGELSGQDAHYPFSVFAVQVKSKDDFDKPHYETESTHWLTMKGFATSGRKSQNKIVQLVAKEIASRS